MPHRWHHLAVAAAVTTILPAPALAGTPYYEATFSGTVTSVDFGALDPGPLVGVAVGQSYTFALRSDLASSPTDQFSVTYPILSSTLRFDDGSQSGIDITTLGPGAIGISATPGIAYQFEGSHAIADAPYAASVLLADTTEPHTRLDTDLPLSLDLTEFSMLDFYIAQGNPAAPDPIHATIDSFSARIVPSPAGVAIAAVAGIGALRRRRSGGTSDH